MRIRINNHVDEELVVKYREALDHIKWLESEVLRLKMLLEGENTMMNSLKTIKPRDN